MKAAMRAAIRAGVQRLYHSLGGGVIYTVMIAHSFAFEPRILSESEIAVLESGQVMSEIWRDKSRGDGALDAFAAVHIKASPQIIWTAMTSCDASVAIVKDMTACEILETSPAGDWDIREQRFRAPFPINSFRSEFRTDFIPPSKMTIQRTGGDMKIQEGVWLIQPLENGYSRVTYQARIALKVPVPRFMMRRALRKDTPALMMALREFSENISIAAVERPAEHEN